MVLPGPARLSVRGLAWLLQEEQIGELHVVLAPTAVWHPPADLDELHAQAREEIAGLGWYDSKNELEIEVRVALAILCRAEEEFFGWITRGQSTLGVLAAGIGWHGMLAVRDGGSVWLKHIRRDALAEALVAQTADVPAGQGRPVTIAHSEAGGERITEPAVGAGPASVAVRRIQQLAALPMAGKGELYAAERDGAGRYRVSEPVSYADTSEERHVTLSEGLDRWLVAPAGRADLVARLRKRLA